MSRPHRSLSGDSTLVCPFYFSWVRVWQFHPTPQHHVITFFLVIVISKGMLARLGHILHSLTPRVFSFYWKFCWNYFCNSFEMMHFQSYPLFDCVKDLLRSQLCACACVRMCTLMSVCLCGYVAHKGRCQRRLEALDSWRWSPRWLSCCRLVIRTLLESFARVSECSTTEPPLQSLY